MATSQPEKLDQRNTRWEAHRRERRRELIGTAISAVQKYGYDASMDQIASESKTSKSILYKYFGNKEGLQYAIGEHTISEMVCGIEDAVESGVSFEDVLTIVISQFLELIEDSPALYRFMKVAEFDDDPNAAMIPKVDRSMIDAWSRLFFVDSEMTKHRYHKGVVHAWLTAVISMVKGVAESWLVVREVTQHPEVYPNAELSRGQANFAIIERDLLQGMLVRSISRMMEEVVVDTYSLLTGEDVSDDKRAELEEHVRMFAPPIEERLTEI